MSEGSINVGLSLRSSDFAGIGVGIIKSLVMLFAISPITVQTVLAEFTNVHTVALTLWGVAGDRWLGSQMMITVDYFSKTEATQAIRTGIHEKLQKEETE